MDKCGIEKAVLLLIFDLSGTTCLDEAELPGFENMIKKFPDTIFIGHGPHFWAEISSDVKKEEFSSYPKGNIKRKGAVERLLSGYPNAYADVSGFRREKNSIK